jgi:hypothetical protein
MLIRTKTQIREGYLVFEPDQVYDVTSDLTYAPEEIDENGQPVTNPRFIEPDDLANYFIGNGWAEAVADGDPATPIDTRELDDDELLQLKADNKARLTARDNGKAGDLDVQDAGAGQGGGL